MTVKVSDSVSWVGIVDWELEQFHGHELSTHRGSSYNAYLIQDEANVLVDTVWGPFAEEFMEKVRAAIDPAEIDLVVANHAEVDHSGALPALMAECPDATLIVSRRGEESIRGYYHEDWDFHPVETRDSVDIGRNELIFVEAPMLHWPDSMFTFLTGENVLMPNDAFGQHYATAHRFNDRVDQEELYEEAFKYYVNILNPFGTLVEKKIEEFQQLDLPVDVIAPSHGVIWREEPLQIVEHYMEWARQEPEDRAVVIYESMWGATRRMATAIGEGLTEGGVDNRVLNAATRDRNDIMVEVARAKTVAVGSPTFNTGVLPTLSPILEDLQGLGFKNKQSAAFGSYGWGGGAVQIIEERLDEAGIPPVEEGLTCQWQPDSEDLERCRQYGRELAEATLEQAK